MSQDHQRSYHETLERVVFVQRIFRFACSKTLDILHMAEVTGVWNENIREFDTAALVWCDMLGGDSLLKKTQKFDEFDETNSSPSAPASAGLFNEDDDSTRAPHDGAVYPGNQNDGNDNDDTTDTTSTSSSSSSSEHGEEEDSSGQGQQQQGRVDMSGVVVNPTITNSGRRQLRQQQRRQRQNQNQPSSSSTAATATAPSSTNNNNNRRAGAAAPTHTFALANGVNLFRYRQQVERQRRLGDQYQGTQHNHAHRQAMFQENGRDRNLNNVFHAATRHEILWVMEQLLKAGLRMAVIRNDKTAGETNGSYPIHVAIQLNKTKSFELLLQYSLANGGTVDCNQNSDTGDTPIFVAVIRNRIRMVQDLVERALVDVNKPSGGLHGSPLVHHLCMGRAMQSQGLDMLKYLLSVPTFDFHVESSRDQHMTALELCMRNEIYDKAKMLLEAGADPNHKSKTKSALNRTCLCLNAHYDVSQDLAMTKLLLKHGANPNLAEIHGFTPLMIAISAATCNIRQRDLFVDLMLNAKKYGGSENANPYIADGSGLNAFSWAVSRKLTNLEQKMKTAYPTAQSWNASTDGSGGSSSSKAMSKTKKK